MLSSDLNPVMLDISGQICCLGLYYDKIYAENLFACAVKQDHRSHCETNHAFRTVCIYIGLRPYAQTCTVLTVTYPDSFY